MSRKDAARAVAEQGLAAARRKGDMHALSEIQSALDGLDAEEDD